ncbi:MAG TPA: hypothetical protein VKH82_01475 [Candidatus Binatia bacterium]|nr:hypothetical protein [Candidatus Binatia bacterium]
MGRTVLTTAAPLRLEVRQNLDDGPDRPYESTLATITAGRTAAVVQLRELADRLEGLALPDVADVLVLLEPTLDDLRRQAALALARAPAGSR